MSSHLGWIDYFLISLLVFAIVFMFVLSSIGLIFWLKGKKITKRQVYIIEMLMSVDLVIVGIALTIGNILDGVPLSDINTHIYGFGAIFLGLVFIIQLILNRRREEWEKEKLKEIELYLKENTEK